MDIDKILALDNDRIRYPDKDLDALIEKLLSVQKDRKEGEQEPVAWPDQFTHKEFEDFVNENHHMLDDNFFTAGVESRDLEDDICEECEECEEHDYSAYPKSSDLLMIEKTALDYFVENIELFTLERLEGLKTIIKK